MIGIIFLGMALVAGRSLVPRPATGNTAVRMGLGLVIGEVISEDFTGLQGRTPIRLARWRRCGGRYKSFNKRTVNYIDSNYHNWAHYLLMLPHWRVNQVKPPGALTMR